MQKSYVSLQDIAEYEAARREFDRPIRRTSTPNVVRIPAGSLRKGQELRKLFDDRVWVVTRFEDGLAVCDAR